MLTVDYRRLEVGSGDRLLDVGAGAGRHAFEALRRGADVVALDLDSASLKDAGTVMKAMVDEGEADTAAGTGVVNGDTCFLPFPDASFDRIIASEVMEHVPDDRRALCELTRVLRPGGTIAVTVPRWGPELVCWALSDDYHAPAVEGGHVRIYRESALRQRMAEAGLAPYDRHHAHGLHSPYWWIKCAVGPHDEQHPLVAAYHRLLVWEIMEQPLVLRAAEQILQPLIGKSLVLYGRKRA